MSRKLFRSTSVRGVLEMIRLTDAVIIFLIKLQLFLANIFSLSCFFNYM